MAVVTPFSDAQNQMIDFSLERTGCNIFARPGKGKTRASLEVIEQTLDQVGGRALVVAPLFPALTVWRQENEKWGYNFNMRLLHGKEKMMGAEDISVINYEGLTWLRNQNLDDYSIVIYDEISKMKTAGTSRFRRWRHHMPKFDYRIGLTGTPRGNNLINLWGQMYCVDFGVSLGRTKTNFEYDFFIRNPYTKELTPRFGAKEEIFEKIKDHALSLDYDKGEMPELIYNPILIDLPPKIRAIYEEMKEKNLYEDVVAVNSGVLSQKLRQMASGSVYDDKGAVVKIHSEKQKAFINLANELQGDPLLVSIQFDHDLTALRQITGDNIPSLDGNMDKNKMVEVVKNWNTGEIPILAAHPATASLGGNMQESGNTLCFYSTPWSVELVEQMIGRIWRTGQLRPVTVHFLLVRGTKDEDIFETVLENQHAQNELFNVLAR